MFLHLCLLIMDERTVTTLEQVHPVKPVMFEKAFCISGGKIFLAMDTNERGFAVVESQQMVFQILLLLTHIVTSFGTTGIATISSNKFRITFTLCIWKTKNEISTFAI